MKRKNVDLNNKQSTNEQTKKQSSKFTAIIAPSIKYILATIAIVVAVIAVFFGESKFTLKDTASANISFNKLYYLNVETGERFFTLKDAVDKSATDNPTGKNTIRVLNGREETAAVTVPAGKEIELDLNGKTVAFNIDEQSVVTPAITNSGTLTITDSTATNDNPIGSGKIESLNNVITNNGNGSIVINSGTLQTSGTGAGHAYSVIDQNSTGTITINNGKIIGNDLGIAVNGEGKVTINNGEVTSNLDDAIHCYDANSSLEINDGKVTGATCGVFSNGNTDIRGGKIESSNIGVNIGGGTTTVGVSDDSVTTTQPIIKGDSYGLASNSGVFNFYDGTIIGPSGNSLVAVVTGKPQGYTVVNGTEVIEGTTYETAFLQKTIPDTIINTESMYVPGAQVRVDGVHNWIGNDKEGKNYETTTWADISGTGNNGAITLGNGKWGENYLEFDGTSTCVNLGQLDNEKQSIDVTFAVSSITSGNQSIIGNWEDAGGGISITNQGKIHGEYYIGGSYASIDSVTIVEPEKVYNAQITYDGNNVCLYVNGVKESEVARQGVISNSSNSTVMSLGSNPSGSAMGNGIFKGKIYSAAVYNRALTQQEVLQNATAGLALAGGPVTSSNITYTVRFQDAVTGFTSDDITLTNATKGAFTQVTAGKVYTIDTTVSANNTSSSITEKITVPDGAATITSSNEPTSEASRTVSILASYKNLSTNTYYYTLEDAIASVAVGTEAPVTIQVLNNTIETTSAEVPANKNVKIDLNGKAIALKDANITNNGKLTVEDSGTNGQIVAANVHDADNLDKCYTIANLGGTFNLTSGSIKNTGSGGIYNIGNTSYINVSGGSVETSGAAITNRGNSANPNLPAVSITGGSVISHGGNTVVNSKGYTGLIKITGGRVDNDATDNVNRPCVINYEGKILIDDDAVVSSQFARTVLQYQDDGCIEIAGGTVENTYVGNNLASYAVGSESNGSIVITGGTISSESSYAVYNNNVNSTVTISGGEITANTRTIINKGTMTISGNSVITSTGTILQDTTNGYYNPDAVVNQSNGTLNVTGGSITATNASGITVNSGTANVTGGEINGKGYGIWATGTSITNVGTNDGTVSTSSPIISATGVSGVGVYMTADATFNFYDGAITGSTGNSCSKEPDNTPTGYTRRITDNGNGTETSTLDNHYNVRYLSGNLLEGYTLFNSENSGESFSGPVNGVYTGTLPTAYGGWYIDESKFTAGKTYLLRYKIQKTAGTLNNIGGHSAAATQLSFNVDGSSSSTIYNTPSGNITNDTNVHTVEFKFTYSPSSTSGANNKIYIQPNRGNSTSVTVNLYDVELYEVVREDTKTYGSTYGTLPTPTARTGYTQQGWARENLFDKNATPVNSSTYIKGDGTTVGSSEYSIYQVNIEPNTTYRIINSGGSTSPGYAVYNSSGTRLSGENYTNRNAITFTTPANAAYIKFSVVKDSASGRYDKDVFYLGKVVNGTDTINVTEDHEVYALWTPNKYTITLNNQNATTAGTTAIYEKYNRGYLIDANLSGGMTATGNPITVPTKTGHTFGGYYTAANGGGTQYINASGYITSSASPTNFTANGTLYAKWTVNNYTITLNPNSGTYNGSTSNSTVTAAYGSEVNLGVPTRTGYRFVEWKTSNGTIYDKNLLKNATAMTSIGTSSSNAAGTWRYASTGKADNDPRTVISVSDAPISGISKGFQIVGNGTSYDISQDAVPVTVGNTYTISVWAKGTGKLNLQSGNSTYAQKFYTLSNVTTWTKYTYTIVAGTNGSANNNQTNIYFGNRGTGTLQICGMKLEENTGFSDLLWSKVPSTTTAPTLVAQWVDDIAPVIVSATASTTTDIASYVDFNATDAGSQIKYYNITTSNTAPTTWIPVVSTVETATETKYENSAAWARVFHHNTHWGNVFYSNADSYAEAKSSSTVDKYSVLGNLANYKNSSNWEFMLQYPDLSATQYNRWTQTVNPATTTVANGTGSETAGGYTAGHIDWNGNYWGGLTLSTAAACFINGSVGHGNWFYAIGAKEGWNGAIPGPNSTGISTVNLWARIDNLTNTTSANLTRRIGDLKSNTTYYVWVKDAAGNTASKTVAVSNVDTTAPTASITSTNNVAASQTATLTLGDNKALDKYYWGTSNPASTNVTYVATSGTSQSITKTVDAAGTYYLAVLDKAGNRTITSKVFYKTTLTPNRGSVSPASVITMSGNSFTIPTPGAVTGYTWGGWYKESGLTTSAGTTWTPTASATLYGKWNINKYYLIYDYQDSYTYSGSDALDTGYKYNWDKNFKVEAKFKVTATGNRYCVFSAYNDTTKNLALEITTDNKLRIFMGNSALDDKSSTAIPINTDITATFQWNAATKKYTLTATGTNVNISMTNTLSSMTGTGTKNVLVGRDERTTTFKSINITMFKISTEYDYNTAISTLPTVTRPGYTYNGWYDAASGGNKVTSVTMPASNKTIYARKTINSYKLTVVPNGGSYNSKTTNTEVTQNYDTTYGLNTATRTGYTFNGWTLSGSGKLLRGCASGKANAKSAQFTETVKTDTNGSQYTNYKFTNLAVTANTWPSLSYSPYTFTAGHTYRISLDLRVNTYNTLGYFQLRHACVANDYNSTGRVAISVPSSAAGAGWKTYTMDRTYSATTIESANGSSNVTINPRFEIYTAVNANTTGSVDFDIRNIVIEDITDNTVISTGTYNGYVYKYGAGAGTLTAQWTANTYTVKYNGNGNTGGSTANSTHTYNTAKALTANGFTRTGYTFAGWSTASGTTAQISDSGEYTGTHASGASGYNDFKQYAVEGTFSSGNIYRLDVDAKGSGRLINYFYGNSGYLQVASWTSSDGRSGTNTDGANDVPLTSSYAHYTVTFKLGSTGNGNIVKRILFRAMPGCSATIKNIRLHKLTAATDVIYENQQSVTNLSSTQGATVNLYATWSPNIYKVTLDNQSATTAGTAAYWYKYNTTFNSIYYYTEAGCYNGITGSKITVPAKTGYTFGGYYTATNGGGTQYVNASGTCVNNIYNTVAANTTLYAYWIPNKYKITLDNQLANTTGTTAAWYYYKTTKTVNNVTAYYYSNEACTTPLTNGHTITIPVKWGYTFGGYYTAVNGGGTQYVNASGTFVNSIYSNVAGNTTLYAKWTEKTYTATLYASEAANPTTGTVPYSDISFLGYAVNLRMTNNSPGYGTYTYKELTPLTSDPLFSSGQNNITAYDNNHTGKVTITRTVSNGGGILTITNAGGTATSPGLGGFVQSSGTVSANKKYVHIFAANLPTGYYFHQANNNMGTGATITWLTSNAGTGNYQVYAYQVNTGSAAGSSAFGNFGHVFVTTSPVRNTAAATGTYTMSLMYSNIFDITSNDAGIGMVDGSAVLTGKMTRDISNSNFTISPTEYIYDGTAKTPTPTVTDNRLDETLTLTKNTEYTIAYSNNTNVGTATATITGKNVFSSPSNTYYIGTKSATFYINNAKLTFNVNGGTISGTSPQYIRKGQTGVFTGVRNSTAGTIPTATKSNYTFNGWWTASSGGTKVINADKSIVASVSNWTDANKKWLRTADSTLYAQWTPKVYTITLNNQSATTAGTTAIYEKYATGYYTNSGATTQMTTSANGITVPTKTGYVFMGYYTATSGGTQYIDENGKLTSSASTTNFTANGTLYAQWDKAVFYSGMTVNSTIKKLFNSSASYTSADTSMKKFTRYTGSSPVSTAHNMSSTRVPIYIWNTNGTVYWWSKDSNPYLAEDSSYLFYAFQGVTEIDMSGISTSNVVYMEEMFYDCRVLTNLNISGFNTSKVTDMSGMFSSCNALTSLNLSHFDTSKVTDMSDMFEYCRALRTLNVSSFSGSNVQSTKDMFRECDVLESLNLSNFKTNKVTNMSWMFASCESLASINLTGFDTSKVTEMQAVFGADNSLTTLDLSSFKTNNVTNMSYLFSECNNLKTIYVSTNFVTTQVTNDTQMFNLCRNLKGGAGTTYNYQYVDKTRAKIDGGTSNPGYFTAKSAKSSSVAATPKLLASGKPLLSVNNNINTANEPALNIDNTSSDEQVSSDVDTKNYLDTKGTSNDAEDDQTSNPTEPVETITVQIENIVAAQIADTPYSTISEAIQAANSGDTIKLQQDQSLEETIEIPNGKNITIDLNGKTLTSSDISTITNNGTLTITSTSNGLLKNGSLNGIVIINKGDLTVDNAIITTSENGGKAVENDGGTVTVKSGKIVTEGIGSIGIYNENEGTVVAEKGIIEVRKSGSKAIYNDANLKTKKTQIVVADDDSIGIYNSKNSISCEIDGTEITVEADEIENYELIKNTDEFKAELEQMKPSYGIYNDSKKEVQIKTATIKVERIKGVGIINNSEGTITLGVDESKDGKEIDLYTASPIIYAIADNTTALINSKEGKINFYDGRILSTSTIKNIITNVLNNYEINEEFDSNNICAFLKLIEVEEKSEEKTEVETKVDSNKEETVVETKEDSTKGETIVEPNKDDKIEEKDTEEK